jgi:hypothetical protein
MAKKERKATEKEVKLVIAQRKKERKRKTGKCFRINHNYTGRAILFNMGWIGGVLYAVDGYGKPIEPVVDARKLPKIGKEAVKKKNLIDS